jgi:tetratricopeptide (TPR) repeat protein
MARARHNIGVSHRLKGDLVQAEACLQEAVALYGQTNSIVYQAVASMDLGNVCLNQGRVEQAEGLYRRAIEIMGDTGYSLGLAQASNNLGLALMEQRKWNEAEDSFQRSIQVWQRLGQPVGRACAEDNLADLYLRQEKWEAAREILVDARQRLARSAMGGRAAAQLADIEAHLKMAEAGLAG